MNRSGRTAALVLGLIAGVINLYFSVINLIEIVLGKSLDWSTINTIYLVFIALALINLVGGCICKKTRIVGGALMAVTAVVLLVSLVAFIFYAHSHGKMMNSLGFIPTIVILGAWLAAQGVSMAAAVLSFVPAKKGQIPA